MVVAMRESVGERGVVRVVAPCEVDIATVEAARLAVARALAESPLGMVFDFRESSFCGSDAAYLLAEAAARCRAMGVAFGVLEGAALTRLAMLLGLPGGEPAWIGWARLVAADRPSRLSAEALIGVVADLSGAQLDAARDACWRDYRQSAAKRASCRRLQIVLGEIHKRSLQASARRTTPPSRDPHGGVAFGGPTSAQPESG